MASKVLTVYIGRFQPLHNGHVHVLTNALRTSDHTLVLVGSSFRSRTIKNPFTFDERKEVIMAWHDDSELDKKSLTVLPLRDQPYSNSKWIESVQKTVHNFMIEKHLDPRTTEVRLTGSDRDESTWYLQAFPQWKLALCAPVPAGRDLSATNLRHELFGAMLGTAIKDDTPRITQFFIEKFQFGEEFALLKAEYEFIEKYKKAWKAAPYAPYFLTVDGVVIQSGHVLVVRRGALPGKGLLALPGGFLDQNERLADGVVRELIEETGLRLADGKNAERITKSMLQGAIKAKEIFDDPNRSLRGRTVTTAYLIRLDDTKPLPKVKGQYAPLHETGGKLVVETADAFWMPIADALRDSSVWFEDHYYILETMLGFAKD